MLVNITVLGYLQKNTLNRLQGKLINLIWVLAKTIIIPVQQQKMRPTNSVIYETLRYTLQAIHCCASYILLNRLGLGINSEFLCH